LGRPPPRDRPRPDRSPNALNQVREVETDIMNMQLLSNLSLLALLTPPDGAEMLALIPGAIVTLVAVLFIIVDVFHKKGTPRDYLAYFSVVGLVVAAASCWFLWDDVITRPVFFGMLYFDRFALFFSALA